MTLLSESADKLSCRTQYCHMDGEVYCRHNDATFIVQVDYEHPSKVSRNFLIQKGKIVKST